jgi:glycine cleavage system transcriptional repressor
VERLGCGRLTKETDMERYAVLTAIGTDRPGLVDEVSAFVLERGGNLEDSRMVNLHGQFAMMMLVSGAGGVIDRLASDLESLEAASALHADVVPADMAPAAAAAPAIPYRLTTSAMDHPGLVQSIAHVLRESGVNIESAETTLQQAPITGTPLFEMELVVAVPAGTPVAKLREAVGAACDELNIDWQLAAL